MIQRMWVSLNRDNRINLRNGYFLVTVLVAVIYIIFIRWLIPSENRMKPVVYVIDQTQSQRFAEKAVQSAGTGQGDVLVILSGVDELRQELDRDQNSIGIWLIDGEPLPQSTLFFQQHQNERVRNLLAVSLEHELREIYGVEPAGSTPIRRTVLRTDAAGAPVPYNLQWVPVLLFTDAAMIGLIFIAALIFMEKEEGTLRAFMVTPGRVWEYLLSKALTLSLLAVLFSAILVLFTLGTGPNYPQLFLIMALGSIFGALVGALVAVYFDNISQFLFPGVAVMLVLSLPSIALFLPSFSPLWVRLLPTYPMVFGLREAVFPTGNTQIFWNAVFVMLAVNCVLLFIGSRAFDRQMARR